jgi:hypothetical protein
VAVESPRDRVNDGNMPSSPDRTIATLFLGLIVLQAAHSIEEYVFRLWEVLPPARFVSALVSRDLPLGFALANAALVLFGVWCYLARVRPGRRAGRTWAWFWMMLEAANGSGHLLFAALRGGYFPGAVTAPLLLACAVALGLHLRRGTRGPAPVL